MPGQAAKVLITEKQQAVLPDGKPLVQLKPPFCPPHRKRRFISKITLAKSTLSLSII